MHGSHLNKGPPRCTKHIWSILNKRNSLWVRWIYAYRIKDSNFWDLPVRAGISWGWRKILNLRQLLRPFIWKRLGDGRDSSMWFDVWNRVCPISAVVSWRMITREGFSKTSTVAEVTSTLSGWPPDWSVRSPNLLHSSFSLLQPRQSDRLLWCNRDGEEVGFSSANVWDAVRGRGEIEQWHNIVWFSKRIPRHAFICWLACRLKLKTHDLLRPWEVGGVVNMNLLCCVLCYRNTESHTHLFFECSYSAQVWETVTAVHKLRFGSRNFTEVRDGLISLNQRGGEGVMGRMLLAASIYHLWQERNTRMFQNHARPPEVLISRILTDV